MKHIKSKIIFESGYSYKHLPTVEDIKDICLELGDIGFSIKFEVFDDFISLYIFKGVYVGEWYRFNYRLVKEYSDRIKEYLGDLYIQRSILIGGVWNKTDPIGTRSVPENETIPESGLISGVCIKFKREI